MNIPPIVKNLLLINIVAYIADIAFENAGGIRAGLSKGDVTYKDIISISPYGNGLVTKKITGKEIIDLTLDGKEIASSTCSKNDR